MVSGCLNRSRCVCGVVWCGVVWCGVVWCVCVCVHVCVCVCVGGWVGGWVCGGVEVCVCNHMPLTSKAWIRPIFSVDQQLCLGLVKTLQILQIVP